ncbi:flagellar hook-basal body complex protein [Fluoribacter gormanii]|uniref:Flagellar hook protein FlgE n=1 Tax=Fluoribacter gormanii TaxID=464 RepID=A0A377GL72_9GAMM|nr:flagellar hook-basal body complex protein [Fluoribacter gormanii]KTD01016.1 flagellar hook protein FlgE [Fluoribacter gormanii]SIR77938.1 flagellar hook protein FlgE [Fluoribacter gormanii]STO25498.1 Flagellar hook protein flgE [Fluoribacter gormanii]
MKKIICFVAFFASYSSFVYANYLATLNNSAIVINSCRYTKTNHPLDVSILNKGYFVLKRGKGNDLYYTRYGSFSFDSEAYLMTQTGAYLQGIDPESPFGSLSKIQIPIEDSRVQATDMIQVQLNFDASSSINQDHHITASAYDSIGNSHELKAHLRKIDFNSWETDVTIDMMNIATGKLIFNPEGKLIEQAGLKDMEWITEQGTQKITLDFEGSTQYATPFQVNSLYGNGYPPGYISSIYISPDGELYVFYSSGFQKKLPLNIAIALFDNPKKLDEIIDNLFVATKYSGPGDIQPAYGYGAFLNGYLEEESCLFKS